MCCSSMRVLGCASPGGSQDCKTPKSFSVLHYPFLGQQPMCARSCIYFCFGDDAERNRGQILKACSSSLEIKKLIPPPLSTHTHTVRIPRVNQSQTLSAPSLLVSNSQALSLSALLATAAAKLAYGAEIASLNHELRSCPDAGGDPGARRGPSFAARERHPSLSARSQHPAFTAFRGVDLFIYLFIYCAFFPPSLRSSLHRQP